jgi:hypothetical protein
MPSSSTLLCIVCVLLLGCLAHAVDVDDLMDQLFENKTDDIDPTKALQDATRGAQDLADLDELFSMQDTKSPDKTEVGVIQTHSAYHILHAERASWIEVFGRRLYVEGKPFFVKGVDYSPVPIGECRGSISRI